MGDGTFQDDPHLYRLGGTVAGDAQKFLSMAPDGGPLSSAEWAACFADQADAVTAGYAAPDLPAAGELYAYRVLCAGRYEEGVPVGPCGWEGASSRRAGSDVVPACPACGGMTEPCPGTPRLRRAQ